MRRAQLKKGIEDEACVKGDECSEMFVRRVFIDTGRWRMDNAKRCVGEEAECMYSMRCQAQGLSHSNVDYCVHTCMHA